MQTYDGYFVNGKFFVSGIAVRLPENKRVAVTVFDEPTMVTADEMEQRIKWLERLNAAIELSADEELPFVSRSAMREPVNLSDDCQ